MNTTILTSVHVSSPWGNLTIITSDLGIAQVHLPGDDPQRAQHLARYFGTASVVPEPNALATYAAEEMRAYLAGQLTVFESPLDLRLTPFASRVLHVLMRVPAGKVTTYGKLAAFVGNPKGARAVGWAVGHNPIPIVIPCHRVLPASGGIGNYGGGVALKRALLALEGVEK